MEIGGYMQLEQLTDHPYYPGLTALNLGRTALTALLRALGCRTLFVPYYLCDSVTEACLRAGFSLEKYHLDEDLLPVLPRPLEEDEYVCLVSYYGQLTDERIRRAQETYGRIIVDHTQSFFQRPLPGVPTLYSVRKYFGVSDGAYLSWTPPEGAAERLRPFLSAQADESRGRFTHLLGRAERPASEFYRDMLQTADTFHTEVPRPMSAITRNLLGAIDYDHARRARNANYEALRARFPEENILNRYTPDGPFAFPLHAKGGLALRKALAARNIFVPTYWKNVLEEMPESSAEYGFAADILPLPCDQRYTPEDMNRMADIIEALL